MKIIILISLIYSLSAYSQSSPSVQPQAGAAPKEAADSDSDADATDEKDSDFKVNVGIFNDGNVAQSVSMYGGAPTGSGARSNGSLGSGNKARLASGPYLVDMGLTTNTEYKPTFYGGEKSNLKLYSVLETTSYQNYTSYDFQGVRLGVNWDKSGEAKDFSSSLYYYSTFYQGIMSQDYIKMSSSITWNEKSPETSLSVELTKYLNNHPNQFSLSVPFGMSWKFDSTTMGFTLTGGYGWGDPSQYVGGPPASITSGDEFSRFTSGSCAISLSNKWNDRWKTSLEASYTNIAYAKEDLPNGVVNTFPRRLQGARKDEQNFVSLDLSYQIKPDHLSTKISLSNLDSISEGYPGLRVSSTVGPPSYNFYRPYAAISLIYEN